MGDLVLDSLEIRNFRCFRDLRIERLGRVNLIVGKNGVGKTALLEALRLYADKGHPSIIRELLEGRGENRSFSSRRHMNREEEALTIKYLFWGRKSITERIEPIQIGPLNSIHEMLTVGIGWAEEQIDEEGKRRSRLLEPGDPAWLENPVPRIVVQIEGGPQGVYPLVERGLSSRWFDRPEFEEISYIFIPSGGLEESFISRLWDNTALTNAEGDVLSSLRIIAPEVERVNLVGEWTPNDERLPLVKIAELNGPIPLNSLGEGMIRMFSLALGLVNSEGGLLLVDEIETGLHYSVQPDMWRLIFETARRLNVQVFATTHSWDCVEAFQHAAVEDTQAEGMVIRLQDKNGDIIAVPYSEHELMIATREQIEVR